MDICNGKCVICSEDTFVLSGKDKQKFVELLKEHYFHANQVNDNKFLLQFKEKRSEKSICISCAYIIECYVNIRNNFCEQNNKTGRMCTICRRTNNLTNGTAKLIQDASNLIKNITINKKQPRFNLICLHCCFCIISWNRVQDLISNYSQTGKSWNGVKKRRHSVENETETESEFADTSLGTMTRVSSRSRSTRAVSLQRKRPVMVTNTNKNKKAFPSRKNSHTNKKLKLDEKMNELPITLEHLSNVSQKISNNEICLNDRTLRQITSDDRMMFDIAYISCATHVEHNTQMITSKKSKTRIVQTKSKIKTPISLRKSAGSRKIETIVISDTDGNEASNDGKSAQKSRASLRLTLRENKGKINSNRSKNNLGTKRSKGKGKKSQSQIIQHTATVKKTNKKTKNKCYTCDKKYTKKYHLKLHELEHESSFTPIVMVKKNNRTDSMSETDEKTATETGEKEITSNEENEQDIDNHPKNTSGSEEKSKESEETDSLYKLEDRVELTQETGGNSEENFEKLADEKNNVNNDEIDPLSESENNMELSDETDRNIRKNLENVTEDENTANNDKDDKNDTSRGCEDDNETETKEVGDIAEEFDEHKKSVDDVIKVCQDYHTETVELNENSDDDNVDGTPQESEVTVEPNKNLNGKKPNDVEISEENSEKLDSENVDDPTAENNKECDDEKNNSNDANIDEMNDDTIENDNNVIEEDYESQHILQIDDSSNDSFKKRVETQDDCPNSKNKENGKNYEENQIVISDDSSSNADGGSQNSKTKEINDSSSSTTKDGSSNKTDDCQNGNSTEHKETLIVVRDEDSDMESLRISSD